ncbi:MAG: M28 family peptidase [Bacteroidia bacterium]|nr:M28 family peptidase [Bacteroidia bacterium]
MHNGADDNASGVAIMLVLAEQLKKPEFKEYNYLFIAFSAHEDGLYGSEAFVTEKEYDLTKVKLMLNFDMVGQLDTINPILKVMKNNSEKYLDSILYKLTKNEFNLIITEDNKLTDATVFINNNIPCITFTTGTHDDYHKGIG